MVWKLLLGAALAASLLHSIDNAQARELQWGIGGPSILKKNELYTKAFSIMRDRGLETYRVNVNLTSDQPKAAEELRKMLTSAEQYGVKLKPVLFVAFHWQDKADTDLTQFDPEKLYRDAYERTKEFIIKFPEINDWEMGNEVNLRSRLDNGGDDLAHPVGWRKSAFDTPRMRLWSAVLRGHSDAIKEVALRTQLPLRRVLNTTGLQFAFLDFMEDQGVGFDVISYHYYERSGIDMQLFPSNGIGNVNLFQQLARFERPVIVNEVNCSEIYNDRYENTEGGKLNDECIRSFYDILEAISNQTIVNIEGVQAHTFVDIPGLEPPSETRFGLMYDLDRPKLAMAVLAKFAGGHISESERKRMEALRLGR